MALVTLAACGGGSDTASPRPSDRPTVAGIVDRLEKAEITCINLELVPAGERELGAREQGECEMLRGNLAIRTYNTNTARDSAVKIGQEFGGIYVVGDRWVVGVDDDATATRVREALGGEVR